jgi:hypothetical protein
MTHERLSPMDAAYLRREAAGGPFMQNVNYIPVEATPALVDASGKPDIERLRRHVESRLHLVPVLRRRVQWPWRGGRPWWVDDASFDIRNHVQVGEPVSLTADGVRALAEALANEPLDRRRPLWKLLVTPPLDDGSMALLWVVHHAVADGGFYFHVADALWDREPIVEDSQPRPWIPEPGPTTAALIADFAPRAARALWQRVVRRDDRARTQAPPAGPFTRRTRHRGFAVEPISLDLIAAVRGAHGCTFTETMLSAVSIGASEYLAKSGCAQLPPSLSVVVPQSVRGEDDSAAAGNLTRARKVALPIGLTGPWGEAERVAAVSEALGAALRDPRPHDGTCEVVVTTLRFPSVTYLLGGRMNGYKTLGTIGERHGVSVVAMTYGDEVNLSLTADPAVVPDPAVLLRCVTTALARLAEIPVAEAATAQ